MYSLLLRLNAVSVRESAQIEKSLSVICFLGSFNVCLVR